MCPGVVKIVIEILARSIAGFPGQTLQRNCVHAHTACQSPATFPLIGSPVLEMVALHSGRLNILLGMGMAE
jgi:hypothetical protein